MTIRRLVSRALDRLGDVCSGDDDPEVMAEEAYTLVFDELRDAGHPREVCQQHAAEAASIFGERT